MKALPAALVLAALAWAYLPGLPGPPVYDDHNLLAAPKLESPLRCLKGFSGPGEPVVERFDYAYRPLTELTFALNWRFHPSLASLRSGNLVLHLANALLVFLLARRLAASAGLPVGPFAAAAASWFALHPVAMHATGYAYQRSTALEAFFAFLALLLWVSPGRAAGARALACALLACLAKETGATVPLLLGALAWTSRGTLPRRSWWPVCLPPLLVAVQVLRAHAARQGGVLSEMAGRGPLEHLAVELPVVLGYLRLHAWPWPLPFSREFPDPRLLPALLAGGVLAAGGAWVLLGPARHRIPRLGLALALGSLALESSVFPIKDAAAVHRCYPGILGSGLLFGWLVCRPGGRALLAALPFLAVLTRLEDGIWQEPRGLCARDLRCGPRQAGLWTGMAWADLEGGDPARASCWIARAGRIPGREAQAARALARARARALGLLGHPAEAARLAVEGLETFPANAEILSEALRWTAAAGLPLESLLARARTLRFPWPGPCMELGGELLDLGRTREAEGVLRRGLESSPGDAGLWEGLGALQLLQARAGEAEDALRQGFSLGRPRASLLYNLGLALAAQGKLDEAERRLEEALRLDPRDLQAAAKLARVREARRKDSP